MAYSFIDEIAAEPVSFVGLIGASLVIVPDSIHKLYSGNKQNILTRFTCGRYLETCNNSRLIETLNGNYYLETLKGSCK